MEFLDQISNNAIVEDEIIFRKNTVVPLVSLIEDNENMKCANCGDDMTKRLTGFTCPKCGLFVACAMDTDMSCGNKNNYNISSGASTSLQVVGGTSKKTRHYIRNNIDYSRKQYETTLSQLLSYARFYSGPKVPTNIIKQTAEYYHGVQQYHIIRAFNRRACMAECMYRILREHGLAKKPKEVIKIFGIEQKDMSNAASILNDLHCKNLLSKFNFRGQSFDAIESYLRQYFKRIHIPIELDGANFMKFCIEIIGFINKYKLITNCITTTKCAGVIYLISLFRKDLCITKEQIIEHCNISKSTFTKFYDEIALMMFPKEDKYSICAKRIKNIFARNGIVKKFAK